MFHCKLSTLEKKCNNKENVKVKINSIAFRGICLSDMTSILHEANI